MSWSLSFHFEFRRLGVFVNKKVYCLLFIASLMLCLNDNKVYMNLFLGRHFIYLISLALNVKKAAFAKFSNYWVMLFGSSCLQSGGNEKNIYIIFNLFSLRAGNTPFQFRSQRPGAWALNLLKKFKVVTFFPSNSHKDVMDICGCVWYLLFVSKAVKL